MPLIGLKRALRRLRLLPREVNDARDEALREWARDIEKTAKDLAPVRKGDLRDSIRARVNEAAGKAWVEIAPGKTREYAYYVEKGTSKMEDQPFLGPAAQIHRRTGERALRRAVPRHIGGG
ncbi:HK97-gp10 family putative phage morphogenesis protein [Streptomyces sp. SP17KL33]|uniref:HK97-gp10 family putative phage morphogenesis protein n=1 Tax=Streptomyces sp. SP17KL33 TaxID=3002534 RepID=UPI003FCE3ABE